MGDQIGVFTDKEVKNLSANQKVELRADVIRALKERVSLGELREKLRKQLSSKYGITLES